jgi:hypothetical protein
MLQCPWSQDDYMTSEVAGTLDDFYDATINLATYADALILAKHHYGNNPPFDDPCDLAVPAAQPPLAPDFWEVVSDIDAGIQAMLDQSRAIEVIDVD